MSTDVPELLFLPTSPYSLMARWALDASAGIRYKPTLYTPIFGEKKLQKRTGKAGFVTVPVLFTREGAITESLNIAKWADDQSGLPAAGKLFPANKLEDIKRFNAKAADLVAYARGIMHKKVKANPGIMVKGGMMPAPVKYFGPLATWLASYMISRWSTKYEDECSGASLDKVKAALQDVRDAVKANNGYLLGHFSYADIAVAVAVLTSTDPLGPPYTPATAEARKALGNDALTAEFSDVVAWAKKIVENHFPAAAKVF